MPTLQDAAGNDIARTQVLAVGADGVVRPVPSSAPIVYQQDETSTALGVGASYVGAQRDLSNGEPSLRPSRIRWTWSAAAAALGGVSHLYLDESPDAGTTWLTTQQTPLPVDGQVHTGEWALGHFRYYRLRLVNGATAQSAHRLTSILVRGDGSTADMRASNPFPVTPAAGTILAANAAVTGQTLDLGANHQWDRARATALNLDAAAAGAVRVEASLDGANWRPVASSAVAAAAGATVDTHLGPYRYVRASYLNGATAATAAVQVALSLLSL